MLQRSWCDHDRELIIGENPVEIQGKPARWARTPDAFNELHIYTKPLCFGQWLSQLIACPSTDHLPQLS